MPYQNTLERLNFFREIQVLPIRNYVDYAGWMENFRGEEEKKIAARVLSFFMYFSEGILDAMFSAAIGHVGIEFKNIYIDWKHQWFYDKCIYSFIPGDDMSVTDSGAIYARKLRNVLGVPKKQIMQFKELHEFLLKNENTKLPVILVDDFVGTGFQCNKAWTRYKDEKSGLSLSEIANKNKHNVVYAPLVANYRGVEYIEKECEGLILAPVHILGKEYNIFEDSCPCWEGDLSLADSARRLFLRKSVEQDLSFNENNCKTTFGYQRQGLALAFSTGGVPDAIPAIFYHSSKTWTPLIPKRYD